MSETRPIKRKIEFIESYWTGGELGSDFKWNDNHGTLTRCRNCKKHDENRLGTKDGELLIWCNEIKRFMPDDGYCSLAESKLGGLYEDD